MNLLQYGTNRGHVYVNVSSIRVFRSTSGSECCLGNQGNKMVNTYSRPVGGGGKVGYSQFSLKSLHWQTPGIFSIDGPGDARVKTKTHESENYLCTWLRANKYTNIFLNSKKKKSTMNWIQKCYRKKQTKIIIIMVIFIIRLIMWLFKQT